MRNIATEPGLLRRRRFGCSRVNSPQPRQLVLDGSSDTKRQASPGAGSSSALTAPPLSGGTVSRHGLTNRSPRSPKAKRHRAALAEADDDLEVSESPPAPEGGFEPDAKFFDRILRHDLALKSQGIRRNPVARAGPESTHPSHSHPTVKSTAVDPHPVVQLLIDVAAVISMLRPLGQIL